MSTRNDYPLFNQWYKNLDWLMSMAERLPKHMRFSLAQRIMNHSLDILELIVEAIYTKERKLLLKQINIKLEVLRICMRICYQRKLISSSQYLYISEEIDTAGRMLGGWIKSL